MAVELEGLLDEYYLASGVDPRRTEALENEIFDPPARHGLDADVGITRDMDRSDKLTRIDAHLCDLKELQIRDGLHILGTVPDGVQLRNLLLALARVPRGSDEGEGSLHRAIAEDLGLTNGPTALSRPFDPLDCDMAEAWTGQRPEALASLSDSLWRTAGDTMERIELAAVEIIENLEKAEAYVGSQKPS